MTARDGKPCIRCGNNEWHKRGACAPCARERASRWQRENPEKNRSRSYKWYHAHPDKAREKSKKWHCENPEKSKEANRKWHQENPDKSCAKSHRRRARKTNAGGNYTAAEWKSMIDHYDNKCLCCGRDDVKLTADHVIPVIKGGTSSIDNIQPLCQSCNSRKHDKTTDYRPRWQPIV